MDQQRTAEAPATSSKDFWAGFGAILPLWLGAVPIGVSYALAAHGAGFHATETILLSLTVFSASAQLSAVNLLQTGAAAETVLITTLLLNLHQMLLGFSIGRVLQLAPKQRLVAAYFLNDGPYGVATSHTSPSFAFLLGAELSMFVVWNAATLLGVLVGGWLPDLAALGLDLMVPLLFLALLLPRLRSLLALLTAVCSGLLTVALAAVVPTSLAVLIAVAASVVGAWLAGGESPDPGRQQR
jgi:predicted branched-subunit amino acid permease